MLILLDHKAVKRDLFLVPAPTHEKNSHGQELRCLYQPITTARFHWFDG
jgi:hypothetical protein